MTPNPALRNAHLQLERLRRHYEHSVRTYDEVSFLDLAHALRNWADMKGTIGEVAPKFNTTINFKWARPTKKAIRCVSSVEHVLAYMPGGVMTFASKGELVASSKGMTGSLSVGVSTRTNPDGSVELKDFHQAAIALDEPGRNAFLVADISRGSFTQWMGAEAVRIAYLEGAQLVRKGISREVLIRRVANTMGGSHPAGGEALSEFDPAVQELMQTKLAGIPLPYFILLKSAQDIVAIAPSLLPAS